MKLFRKLFGQSATNTLVNIPSPKDSLAAAEGTYPGSSSGDMQGDFLGDWRSADGWMRFDMHRVRSRSRQLERGNPWCASLKKSVVNNVVGSKGFRLNPNITTSKLWGDLTEGETDEQAVQKILLARKQFELAKNFTTRKQLCASDVDRLQLIRLIFDGEVIFRNIKKFDNDFGHSWQMIDPDYLDHNLNRIEPNGDITKMGVRLDKDYKFPKSYFFRYRRPNDYHLNYSELANNLYFEVPAEDIIHIFLQTDDSEQTRGFPWIFSAAVNLFRLGKFEEAALINAVIGASKMGFFKKTVPDGFEGDWDELRQEDDGAIIDEVSPGSWQELPWNVEPVQWDSRYPDEQFEGFEKAMLRGVSASLGTSYMSLTGDASEANHSSQRDAKDQENENWMQLQDFWVRRWKQPEYEEFIYRGLLSQKIKLPFSKLEKILADPLFTGRRWKYMNPVDDMRAKQIALTLGVTSPTEIIEEMGGDRDRILRQIARDKKDFGAIGIDPFTTMQQKSQEQQEGTDGGNDNGGKPKKKKDPKKD